MRFGPGSLCVEQSTREAEYAIEHGLGQFARERILLAWMETAHEPTIVLKLHTCGMSELRQRSAQPLAPPGLDYQGTPGNLAQRQKNSYR